MAANGSETVVSTIIYNATTRTVLNLIAPASAQPLAPEFQRLSADMEKVIGGTAIQNLSKAEESATQRDLTLLFQSTGWDARLLAIAATAAQLATTTGMGADALYALFRCGLRTDPRSLALIPSAAVGAALQRATSAGIVDFGARQISAAQTAFTAFASKTMLSIKVPGAPSTSATCSEKPLAMPACRPLSST